jgi:hypothetical protein
MTSKLRTYLLLVLLWAAVVAAGAAGGFAQARFRASASSHVTIRTGHWINPPKPPCELHLARAAPDG